MFVHKLFFSLKYHFEMQIHLHHPTRGVRDYSPSLNNFYVKFSRYPITYNKNIVYVGVPGVSSVPKMVKSIVNVSLIDNIYLPKYHLNNLKYDVL